MSISAEVDHLGIHFHLVYCLRIHIVHKVNPTVPVASFRISRELNFYVNLYISRRYNQKISDFHVQCLNLVAVLLLSSPQVVVILDWFLPFARFD